MTNVKAELKVGGTLQTRTLMAPFGYEEIEIVYGVEEDKPSGRLVMLKFLEGARSEDQGPSKSKEKSEVNDGPGGSRQSKESMQQDPDQAEKEDDKSSTGGVSSLDFNFLSDFENGADTLETTEPADKGTSTLEPSSPSMEKNRISKRAALRAILKTMNKDSSYNHQGQEEEKALPEYLSLGTLPKEEWEVHQRDHENRTGCRLDRVAFMVDVWTVV